MSLPSNNNENIDVNNKYLCVFYVCSRVSSYYCARLEIEGPVLRKTSIGVKELGLESLRLVLRADAHLSSDAL